MYEGTIKQVLGEWGCLFGEMGSGAGKAICSQKRLPNFMQ
jgi:hypothetical protein